MTEEEIILITQFPSDSWFEGFTIRPNGQVLATRLDKPELYTFDASDPSSEPQLLRVVPDCNSLVNICPIPGREDEYFLLASTADLETVSHSNVFLWRLVINENDEAELTRVTSVQESGYCLGVEAVNERIVLLPDGKTACIWHLDTQTGIKTLFANHVSMEPGKGDGFFGVNRIQLRRDFVYFSNSSEGTVCRIPIELDPAHADVGIRVAGPVQTIVDGLPSHLDGLAVAPDQSHAYAVSHVDGCLHKILIDRVSGKGTAEVIMSCLDSPTGLNLTPCPDDPERLRLYIVCCGEIEVAWMPREDNPWEAIRDINSAVTVTVTQEIVETSC